MQSLEKLIKKYKATFRLLDSYIDFYFILYSNFKLSEVLIQIETM